MLEAVLQSISAHGAKAMAKAGRLSSRYVLKLHQGQSQPSDKALAKLYAAMQSLEADSNHTQATIAKANALIASKVTTCRTLAAKLGTDASNLAKVLSGGRNATNELIRKLAGFIHVT